MHWLKKIRLARNLQTLENLSSSKRSNDQIIFQRRRANCKPLGRKMFFFVISVILLMSKMQKYSIKHNPTKPLNNILQKTAMLPPPPSKQHLNQSTLQHSYLIYSTLPHHSAYLGVFYHLFGDSSITLTPVHTIQRSNSCIHHFRH